MTERLRVREIDDDEGRRPVRVVRRGSGSVVTWRLRPAPSQRLSWRYALWRTCRLVTGRSHRPRSTSPNQARLAFLAVTHRYKQTNCLWLEQFQIADLVSAEGREGSRSREYRTSISVRLHDASVIAGWRASSAPCLRHIDRKDERAHSTASRPSDACGTSRCSHKSCTAISRTDVRIEHVGARRRQKLRHDCLGAREQAASADRLPPQCRYAGDCTALKFPDLWTVVSVFLRAGHGLAACWPRRRDGIRWSLK